jgi:hypothetical protein
MHTQLDSELLIYFESFEFQDLLARLSSSLSPIGSTRCATFRRGAPLGLTFWIQQLFHNVMHRQPLTSAAAGSIFILQDLLARLSPSLSLIEQYAVRRFPYHQCFA